MAQNRAYFHYDRMYASLRDQVRDQPAKQALAYLVLALLWIYGTDSLMAYFYPDSKVWITGSLYKGLFFVAVTAALLYRVLSSRLNALRQAIASHYEYVVSNANDILFLSEANEPHRLVEANERAVSAYGYSREELFGMNAEMLRVPEQRGNASKQMAEFFAENPGALYEVMHQRKDGTTFPVEISGRQVVIGGKRFYQAVIRDISERKRYEQVLLSSRKRLMTLLDNLPDAAWMLNHEGVYIAANKEAAKFFNIEVKDVIGRNFRDLFPSKWTEHIVANEKTVISSQAATRSEMDIEIGGERFWWDVSVMPIVLDEGEFGTVGIAHDVTEFKRYQSERSVYQERLKEMLTQTIHAMTITVEKRDPYTAGHQGRTADLAVAIATEMGLSSFQIEGIRFGGMIHDIGKIYIPSEILNRPGRLTVQEMALIRTHPEVGYDIVKGVDFIWPVKEIVLHHHERMDGSGYPHGLKGEQIALEARIVGVADVVEAISSHRPYRPALGIELGLEEIRAGRATRYDATVVDACLKLFAENRFDLTFD